MAALTVVNVTRTGVVVPAQVACGAGGDTFVNDGKTYIRVDNASGSAKRVVVDAVKNCDQGFDHNVDVSVPNASNRMIGPFAKSEFNNSAGACDVSYPDGVTSLTVSVLSVP